MASVLLTALVKTGECRIYEKEKQQIKKRTFERLADAEAELRSWRFDLFLPTLGSRSGLVNGRPYSRRPAGIHGHRTM